MACLSCRIVPRETHTRSDCHFIPTGVSLPGMVEAWFGIPTCKAVSRGFLHTVDALTRHTPRCIDRRNDNPTPFVGTKEPPAIIEQAMRRPH